MRRPDGIVARFLDDETGATMVEYGAMLALIVAVCFAIVATLGTSVQGLFSAVNAAWAAA